MAGINPKNLTAQHSYRAAGNPPSTLPSAAISNFYPGLEFDLRSLWKHIFVGIELHESGLGGDGHLVLDVVQDSTAAGAGVERFDRLISVDGKPTELQEFADDGPLPYKNPLEFFNSLAELTQKPGELAQCVFHSQSNNREISVKLEVRSLFEGAAFARDILEAGAMTQGLCSPWQADYRECGCYYWAASRPDFINARTDPATQETTGHSWMQPNRGAQDPYVPDRPDDPTQITYDDLYQRWQQVLRFVIGGRDSE